MTSATLENSNTTSTLNPVLYSLFAKASYCKNTSDKKVNAQGAINSWLDVGENENPIWEVMSGVAGIGADGVSSAWAGFQAVAYKNETTKEIVIAYRGTDSALDILYADAQIAFNAIPQQVNPALEFYDTIYNTFKDDGYSISITGHSFGGTIAQYVAASKHVPAVTFNAPGVVMPAGGDASGIVNYVNMNDFIGCLNPHLGVTRYYLPDGIYMDGDFKPHSDYIGQNFSKYITLPAGVTWTLGHSLALWGYDESNNNVALKASMSALITEKNLTEAAEIIQQYFGKSSKLESSFNYFSMSKGYIIGSGPAGLMNAYKNVHKNRKVLMIEAGKNRTANYCNIKDLKGLCLDCKPCNNISGFGGCA